MGHIRIVGMGLINRYLVEAGSGWVLVDTGIPRLGAAVLRRHLDRARIPADTIRLIVLTHGHVDHAGAAAAVQNMTGAPIAIHCRDSTLLSEGRVVMPAPWTGLAKGTYPVLTAIAARMHFAPARADILLDDAAYDLESWGLAGSVLHTPGHTSGSVSVVLDSGEAFVGDLVARAPGSGEVRLPPAGEDRVAMETSLERLLQTGVRRFFPGHGGSFDAGLAWAALGKRK
jgi:hydroxyacylglutathione hydrolase